jgi:hypothetical protein
MLRTDNSTTLWNIRKHGGTQSLELLNTVKKIWAVAMRHQIRLSTAFIPGVENQAADAPSSISSRDDYHLESWVVKTHCPNPENSRTLHQLSSLA